MLSRGCKLYIFSDVLETSLRWEGYVSQPLGPTTLEDAGTGNYDPKTGSRIVSQVLIRSGAVTGRVTMRCVLLPKRPGFETLNFLLRDT